MDVEGEEMDAATELRAVIRCVLEDSMRPALRDLQGALASGVDSARLGTKRSSE